MSYDIELKDAATGEVLRLDVPHEMRGGTHAAGGTQDCWLNITYNYAPHYYRVFPEVVSAHPAARDGKLGGVRSIYGMTGAESIPVLKAAIAQLGNDVHEDYWEPTEGNAKAALFNLLALAQLRSDGVWDGD